MIRIVTTRRLAGLEDAVTEATTRALTALGNNAVLEAARQELQDALTRSEGRHADAAISLEITRHETERLREENAELLEEVRAAKVPDLLFVLSRFGELHSLHTSQEAAIAEAGKHGAPTGNWVTGPTGKPLADYSWLVTALPLARSEASTALAVAS
jgi:hypothetical protein